MTTQHRVRARRRRIAWAVPALVLALAGLLPLAASCGGSDSDAVPAFEADDLD